MTGEVAAGRSMNSPVLVSVARLMVLAASFAVAPIIARDLGPSGRGLYAGLIGVLGVSPVLLGLGLPLAVRVRASKGVSQGLLRSICKWIPIAGVVGAGVGSLLAFCYFRDATLLERIAFIGAVAFSPVFIYTLCAQSVLICRQHFAAIAILQCAQGLTSAIFTVSVWICVEITIGWLLLGYVLGTLVSAVAAVRLTHGDLRGRSSSVTLWQLCREGSRFVISQLAETAGPTMPLILAITAIGAHEAGLLSVGVTLSTIPLAIGYAIGSVAFGSVASTTGSEHRRIVTLSLKSSIITGLFGAIILAAATPILLPALFGSEFAPAVPAAIILSLASSLTVVNYVGTQILAAESRAGSISVSQGLGLGISVAGLYVFGFYGGSAGAAFGVAFGWLALSLCIVRLCRQSPRLVLISPRDVKDCYRLLVRGDVTAKIGAT